MRNIFVIFAVFLGIQAADSFVVRPASLRKTAVAVHMSSTAGDSKYLYRQEPTALERKEAEAAVTEGAKHSTFHVEKGPGFADDKADPAHSFHHHLIDVDHDKIHDLDMRAQHAWTPVNVHEIDVDAVTLFAVVFGLFALILFSVQQ